MDEKTCALDGCNEPLPTQHQRRKYCSMNCAQKAYYRRKHHIQPRRDKCESCGGPLPEGCQYNRMYCSSQCKEDARWHREHPTMQRKPRTGKKSTDRLNALRAHYEKVLYGR